MTNAEYGLPETSRPRLSAVNGLAVAATVLIGVSVAAQVVSLWATWNGYQVVQDFVFKRGLTFSDVTDADALITRTSWIAVITLVLAGVTFIAWLWRARRNAERLCQAPHRRSLGWIIGSWFVPIVNLWFPYQIVNDVYRASRPDNPADLYDLRTVPGSRLLGYWWALVLGGAFLGRIAARLYRDEDLTVDSLRTVAVIETVGTGLSIAAAVLVVVIIRRITEWQSRDLPTN